MEENKSKAGRKALPEHEKKRTRYIMANDKEWAKLLELSDKAGLSTSAFIIDKLKLNKE
jgi:hypothetical protein